MNCCCLSLKFTWAFSNHGLELISFFKTHILPSFLPLCILWLSVFLHIYIRSYLVFDAWICMNQLKLFFSFFSLAPSHPWLATAAVPNPEHASRTERKIRKEGTLQIKGGLKIAGKDDKTGEKGGKWRRIKSKASYGRCCYTLYLRRH